MRSHLCLNTGSSTLVPYPLNGNHETVSFGGPFSAVNAYPETSLISRRTTNFRPIFQQSENHLLKPQPIRRVRNSDDSSKLGAILQREASVPRNYGFDIPLVGFDPPRSSRNEIQCRHVVATLIKIEIFAVGPRNQIPDCEVRHCEAARI